MSACHSVQRAKMPDLMQEQKSRRRRKRTQEMPFPEVHSTEGISLLGAGTLHAEGIYGP
jgi:hypothetical protein